MVIANLPPLKHGGPRTPVTAGSWQHGEVNLQKLAAFMDISAEGASAHQLKSIPDAWARVQISRQAFAAGSDVNERGESKPRHVAYAEIRRHWRGLLALFGLALEYQGRYQLIVRPLTLPQPPQEGVTIGSADMFASVLSLLPPTATLHPKLADWRTLGLIQVQDAAGGQPVTVGLLSPDILVTSGKSVSDVSLASVPWFRKGPQDPTTIADMKSLDFHILQRFLDRVLAELNNHNNQHSTPEVMLHDRLVQELQDYRKDCQARAAGMDHRLRNDPDPITAIDIPTTLHRVLGSTFKINPDAYPVGHSECLLKMREDVKSPLRGVVLVDQAIADDYLKRPANQVTVWRHLQLNDATDPAVLEWIRQDAAKAGYLVVTAEDFFTPDLILFEDGTDIPGHLADSFNNALLPLTPLALLVMTPGELIRNIRMDPGPGVERRVSLTLPLNNGAWVNLAPKRYDKDLAGGALRQNVIRPVNLAVWPDFQSPTWPWNYLRYNFDPSSTDLQTRFGVSAQQIAKDLQRENSSEPTVARAREWFSNTADLVGQRLTEGYMTPSEDVGSVLQRLRFQSQPTAVGEIQISSSPFEALCFSRRRDRNTEPKPVGMALLQVNPKTSSRIGGVVAIDFGTTNTVVATSPAIGGGAKNGQALTLRKRTVFPITARSPQQQGRDVDEVAWTFRDFMPLMNQATPIPTVAEDRLIQGGHMTPAQLAHDPRPLFSDSIFFFPAVYVNEELKRQVTMSFLDLRPTLIFGLKWNPEMEEYAKNFLRQLVLMSAAELVAEGFAPDSISWRFSYPEAMRGNQAERLETNYTDIINTLFQATEENRVVPGKHRLGSYTESEAAAAFFLEKGVVRSLAIILDIGGGTTDIAIWLRDGPNPKMLWHGSVKIAGGDFMTHYLVNNPKFLDELGIQQISKVSEDYVGEESSLRRTESFVRGQPRLKDLAELFFSDERFPEGFKKAYDRLSERALGAGLRHSAVAATSGLLYYVGKVIRQLIDQGVIKESQYENPTIAFGGRGALFLKLLGGANPEQSRRLKAMAGVMTRSAGLDPKAHEAQIYFSPEPKLEAVLGMIQTNVPEAHRGDGPSFLPIGEVLAMTGENPPGPWDDVQTLMNRDLSDKPQLEAFETFLQVMFEETGLSIDLDGSAALNARGVVADYVNNQLKTELQRLTQQGQAKRSVNVDPIEPPFIMALRALLDRLGQSEAVRTQFLKVAEDQR